MLEFINTHPTLSTVIACLLVAFVAFIVWIIWANKAIKLTKISVKSNTLRLKIAHISDFHNAKFKNNNEKLLTLIKNESPDIIAITGDFIDSRHTNVERSVNFAKELVKIAPCYYAPGNHESRMAKEYNELKKSLLQMGVTVLCDESVTLEKNAEVFTIIGIEDPMFVLEKDSADKATQVISRKLKPLASDTQGYTIVLSHRPEAFSTYVDAGVNLALTGHAHGGQVQIPFVGGLIAPNQGFFPKYSEGVHTEGNTNMVISRGIGNSLCPIRVNNRPEIILIEITQ